MTIGLKTLVWAGFIWLLDRSLQHSEMRVSRTDREYFKDMAQQDRG
jgi:hypothetical protein